MIEFLIIIGLIWLIAASLSDIRKKEVPNWLSFSLIAVGLAYRLIFSIINWETEFIFSGLIGLLIFVVLGYAFYYARVFAGGDAKLLMALGVVLPFSEFSTLNLIIFSAFLFLVVLSGSVYGLIFSFFLVAKHKKRFFIEFKKHFNRYKPYFYSSFLLALFLVLIFFLFSLMPILFLFVVLILLIPLLMTFAKALEEACMIKEVRPGELTEGDWLYENIVIGRKIIKPNWEGLTKKEIMLISKNAQNKKILIKQGIPFVPVFLVAYILLLILIFLRNSGWEFWQFLDIF